MKFRLLVFVIGIFLFNISCGISPEVRIASTALLEQKLLSDSAQIAFHKTVIESITLFLEIEQDRSKSVYDESLSIYKPAFDAQIEAIFKPDTPTMNLKMMKFVKAQSVYENRLSKASANLLIRNALIKRANDNIKEASEIILLVEKKQYESMAALDAYLQEERPIEVVQNELNINFQFFNEYLGKANTLIEETKPMINQIKSLAK